MNFVFGIKKYSTARIFIFVFSEFIFDTLLMCVMAQNCLHLKTSRIISTMLRNASRITYHDASHVNNCVQYRLLLVVSGCESRKAYISRGLAFSHKYKLDSTAPYNSLVIRINHDLLFCCFLSSCQISLKHRGGSRVVETTTRRRKVSKGGDSDDKNEETLRRTTRQ